MRSCPDTDIDPTTATVGPEWCIFNILNSEYVDVMFSSANSSLSI